MAEVTTYLATAVGLAAARFITNNQRGFPAATTKIRITCALDLPTPPHEDPHGYSVLSGNNCPSTS
jgi:hypothetical protein